MKETTSAVTINEIETEPLSEYVISFLSNQKKESPYLDFKWTINVKKDSDFPEIVKDIFAFSNYGGGWILIGWKEEKSNYFVPLGVPADYDVDQATLQEKFNSFVDNPIELQYREITDTDGKRFGFIFIPPSNQVLTPNKDGRYKISEKERMPFRKGDIFYRRGTQSIKPSEYERKIMEKRLLKEKYRLSILSGQPDEVEEEISSNLFEVLKIPEYVYLGTRKFIDDASIKMTLKQAGVFPEFYYKFTEWNKKIVSFENLQDSNNRYSKIIESGTVIKENVREWLGDQDKSRIIIRLFSRELRHYAISNGFYFDEYGEKLYYSTTSEKRKENWSGIYRTSTKTVAAKMYAEQLGFYIFVHPAFYASFIRLGTKIYMELLPTFILTEDGRRAIRNVNTGSVITRLSYNKYNAIYLNNISFWINKLGNGKNINISNYLEIDCNPSSAKLGWGILFDIPSTEFILNIDETEKSMGEDSDDSF